MQHPNGLPGRQGRSILDMLETVPAGVARRIEPPRADLPVDAELDWEPRPLARAIRSGRRFRWTVVITALLVAAGLYGGWRLGLEFLEDHTATRAASFREAAADTLAAHHGVTAGAAAITDAGIPLEDVTAAIGSVLRLDAHSTRLAGTASAWLLDLPDWIPTPTIADLSEARRSLEELSSLTSTLAARLQIVADYRLGMATILTLPELPSPANPIPAAIAQDRLASALATAVTTLGDLPDDPSLAAHRDAIGELIGWMSDWQQRYVGLLRAGDLSGARAVEREARGRIDLIRLELNPPLADIGNWAEGLLASIESAAGRVLLLSGS